MTQVRVRYKDAEASVVVTLIHTWHRNDYEITRGYAMSSSGGPKETLRNQAVSLFEADPTVDAVSYVFGRGLMFFIIRRGRQHFDVTHREVVAERVAQ